MHRHGIRAMTQRRFRVVTTDSNHSLPVAANLLDQTFLAARPNEICLANITYIPTDEGWLYRAIVLDLFSRKVVGWAMRDHMRQELTIAALDRIKGEERPWRQWRRVSATNQLDLFADRTSSATMAACAKRAEGHPNSGSGSRRWPTCCSMRCAGPACATPGSPTPPAAPSV
jgi:transposase InsO family protein